MELSLKLLNFILLLEHSRCVRRKEGRKDSGQQTFPLYNIYYYVNIELGRQRTKVPLVVLEFHL